jgi:segregation and condensation protein A
VNVSTETANDAVSPDGVDAASAAAIADAAFPVTPDADVAEAVESDDGSGFVIRLTNFTGPFDLLLQLIGKHKLDVTEVALHKVTDEFIAYIRAMGDGWDLDEVSEFLVVASTLLDLKAARLLPTASVEDEEDLALLEARDLLFARLLQYKAYKEAAGAIAQLETNGARRYPRAVNLEPRYAEALPDLVLGIGPQRLAQLAAKAMTPKKPPIVSVDHIHMVRVSVREHAAILRRKLIELQTASFRTLCSDCQSTLEIVARFLALLELYRDGSVGFDQVQALGELTVRWTGSSLIDAELDVDEYSGTVEPQAAGDGPAPAEQSGEESADDRRLSGAEGAPAPGPEGEPNGATAIVTTGGGDENHD